MNALASDKSGVVEGKTPGRPSGPWILYPLGLAVAAALLYLLTMPGDAGGETDAAGWQFMGKVCGVPDAPGYPLYILLNHLFSLIPFGSLAWRINLLSAVFAVLALVFMQRVLARLLKSEILACGGPLLLAVSRLFWISAVVAGPHSLNVFFVSLLVYLLFKWMDRPAPRGNALLYAAFVAYALSLGNGLTMLTMLPAIAFLVMKQKRRAVLSGRTVLVLVLCAIVLAGLYGLLFIFTSLPSVYLSHRIASLGDLREYIAGAGLWQNMFTHGVRGFLSVQLPYYMNSIGIEFTVIGFVLIAAGLFLFASNYRSKLWFLLIYLLVDLLVALNHYTADVMRQVMPSYFVLALLTGCSMGLFQVIARLNPGARAAGFAACMLALAAIAANLLVVNSGELSKSRAILHASAAFARDIVDAMPRDAVILANNPSDSNLFLYEMLGEEYGAEKGWLVWQSALWKRMKADTSDVHRFNGAALFDVSEVDRLLRGERVDWGPLTAGDAYQGGHAVFFTHMDKIFMDMAGFISEPVDLPGDGDGENRYGDATIRLYRIVETPNRKSAGEVIETYNRGLDLLANLDFQGAQKIFESLLEYNPKFAEAIFQVGMCYRGMRNYEEARKKWKEVLELAPGYSSALDALGTLPLPKGQAIAEARNHSVE